MSSFSPRDYKFMHEAFHKALEAFQLGNYPVGAVLAVDGTVIAKASNCKDTNRDRISHAEMILMIQSSALLKEAKEAGASIELFTTFEPCLMCLGTSVIHEIDRIVVACHDPQGDISSIKPQQLGMWYVNNWPKIEYGLLFDESYQLFIDYFNSKSDTESSEVKELFLRMKEN